MTLTQYMVDLQEDHKHLSQVSHPRLAQTPFRSPQLALFDLGPGEWLLYWKTPELAPARRRRRVPGIVQLPLFDLEPIDLAVGAGSSGRAAPHVHLHLVEKPPSDQ